MFLGQDIRITRITARPIRTNITGINQNTNTCIQSLPNFNSNSRKKKQRNKSMLVRSLAFLFLIGTSLPVLAENFLTELINAPKYKWVSLGYSQDIREPGTRGLVFSGGLFPEETGFGFQAYLETTKLDMPDDTDMVHTAAVESILKWKWIYGGMGVAISDRTTAVSGTYWNFTNTLGVRYMGDDDWFLDFNIRHRSHAGAIFQGDKENAGMTAVNLQFGLTF
jgi:hypothetical protein